MAYNPIKETIEDPIGTAKWSMTYVAGKTGITVLNGGTSFLEGARGFFSDFGSWIEASTGVLSGMGKSIGVLAGIGVTTALSAGIVQIRYNNSKERIKNFYREGLAKEQGKSANGLTANDLQGTHNQIIEEAVYHTAKNRNFDIFLSVVSSLASFAILGALVSSGVFTSLHGESFIGKALEFGVKGLIGLASYMVVKTPLHWVGNKLFQLSEETTHDRILALDAKRKAGKEITPEEVLSVYASAHPQLDQADIRQLAPLRQLAETINNGKLDVSALAFAAVGDDVSALVHEASEPKKSGMLRAMWTKMRSALHFKPHPKVEAAGAAAPSPEPMEVVPHVEEKSGRSFVQRLGRGKLDTPMGYVKQLEQRAQNAPTTQSIQ